MKDGLPVTAGTSSAALVGRGNCWLAAAGPAADPMGCGASAKKGADYVSRCWRVSAQSISLVGSECSFRGHPPEDLVVNYDELPVLEP